MNETLQAKLLQYLEAAESAVQNGAPIVAEEMKALATEIATFGFWSNIINCICYILFYIFLGCVIRFLYKKLWSKANFGSNSSENEVTCIATIISGTICAFFVLISIASFVDLKNSALQATKAAVTPRIYVIEYLNDLTKDSKES